MELFAVELDRAVLEAGCTQFLGEGIELDELLGMFAFIGILLGSRGCGFACAILHTIVFEQLLYLLVGIAAIAADNGMCKVPLLDVRLIVELEDNAVTEFLLVGTEGADEVAEALWQHRDGTINEVNAGGAGIGFLVDDRTFFHIVGDIGDMYADFPKATVELTDGEGIVEVLGILGVDGTGEDVAEVLAAVDLLLSDSSINLLSSLLDILRILIWQVILG